MEKSDISNLIGGANQKLLYVYPVNENDRDQTATLRSAVEQAIHRGVTVDYFCCIADDSYRFRPKLNNAVEEDRKLGVNVRLTKIDIFKADAQQESTPFHFLIIDDVAYKADTANLSSSPSWSRVTDSPIENRIKASLENLQGSDYNVPKTDHQRFTEPLLLNIPIAQQLAKELCRDEHNCFKMHSIWPLVRFLKLAPSPDRNDNFYKQAFAKISGQGGVKRILNTATCDAAMLTYLFSAFDTSADIEVTVIDQCETPLKVCEWYASLFGKKIRTCATDIFTYEDEPFDLICTDSFIARFPPDLKPALMRKMSSLLRPGGLMVTASRIDLDWTEERIEMDESTLSEYKRTMSAQVNCWKDFLDQDVNLLCEKILEFRRNNANFSVRSEDEIRHLFMDNGFSFEWFTVNAVNDRTTNPRSDSKQHNPDYTNIIARKT